MMPRGPAVGRRSAAERRVARRFGQRAEWLAAAVLVLRGYRILARGFVVSGGEIDIIVRRGSTIAFVEVKARPDLDTALLSLTPAKRRRVARAASVWLARNPWALEFTLRGDAVVTAPRRWPRHIEDAFTLGIG